MQNRHIIAALVSVAAPVAAAQTELCLLFSKANRTDWTLRAHLLNPTGTVLATIADLGFAMFGTNISNFQYNPAFDSDFFGDANVNVTSTSINFSGGNTLPPLSNAGGVDSSNPLHIATFSADSIDIVSFTLVGQVTGAYAGTPFPTILTYQNADGSAGNTAWNAKFPAPSSAALLGFGGIAAARRRR